MRLKARIGLALTAGLLVLSLAPTGAPPVHAQTAKARESYTIEDLRRVERARDEALARLDRLRKTAGKADREASAIDADLIAAAADSRRHEDAVASAEQQIAELEADMSVVRKKMGSDQAAREDLLAALMTMGGRRPPALTASPEATGDAVRTAILISEIEPALSERAADLAQTLGDLRGLTDEQRRLKADLAAARQALTARQTEIEALAAERRLGRTALAAETAAAAADADRLAREADTLRDLLDGLTRNAPSAPKLKPAPGKAVPAAKTQPSRPAVSASLSPTGRTVRGDGVARLVAPVAGQRRTRFGQATEDGRAQGVTYRTHGGAQVLAPKDARIEYAGAFRSYGQMLILDVGDNILMVVSGLGALYSETGQWVLAGEPIGRMASQAPGLDLYLEVRRDGKPIDPEAWLAGRK